MIVLRIRELSLRRPVRVLHARLPHYVVPRADGLFMVGATMLESDDPTACASARCSNCSPRSTR